MSVYFRFKSSTVEEAIPIDGPFIPLRYLKEKIIERKKMGRQSDIVIINPKTNEEYVDEETLIHTCSSVIIRRIPKRYLLPIVIPPASDPSSSSSSVVTAKSDENSSAVLYPEDLEWDEFAAKELNSSSDDYSEAKSKSGSVVMNPADGYSKSGKSESVAVAQSYNRRAQAPPPPGYVCHRCRIPGHFIQHCPTNSDLSFEVKKLRRPIGIPKSMLVPSSDGSYALPTGDVAEMKPNEAAFEKAIECVPIRNSGVDLPPELHCPLCENPMKDAVFTSKCCFRSFCDGCIRDHIITKDMCECGATGVLADALLPNATVRETINRMLWSDYSSSGRSSCSSKSDEKTSQILQPVQSSHSHSSCSSSTSRSSLSSLRNQIPAPALKEETSNAHQTVEKIESAKVADVSESVSLILCKEEEIEQNVPLTSYSEIDCKKTKMNDDVNKQRSSAQNFPVSNENYIFPTTGYHGPGPYAYNPYWNPYMSPYANFNPGMVYGVVPMNNIPSDAQTHKMPTTHFHRGSADGEKSEARKPHSHRDAADVERFEDRKPNLKRKSSSSYYRGAADEDKFEARKPDMKRRRESERYRRY